LAESGHCRDFAAVKPVAKTKAFFEKLRKRAGKSGRVERYARAGEHKKILRRAARLKKNARR